MMQLWKYVQRLGLAFIFFSLLLEGLDAHAANVTYKFSRLGNDVNVVNPERGTYTEGSFNALSCPGGASSNGTKYDNIRTAGRSLGYDRAYLDPALKTRAFTSAELTCQRLNALEAAKHGVKLVVRYAYTNQSNDDADSQARVYGHIDQLAADVWEPAKAMFAYWESGFLGAFGESHNSIHFVTDPGATNCGDMDEFYDYLVPKIPAGRKTTQRKAGYVGIAACAPYDVAPTNPLTGTTNNDRIMAHSDGVAKNINYGHTYDCNRRAAEEVYWAARQGMVGETDGVAGACTDSACKTPSSAQERGCCTSSTQTRCNAIYDASYYGNNGTTGLNVCPAACSMQQSSCGTSLAALNKMHQVALRDAQDAATHEVWDRWTTEGCASTIRAHLGYRFVVSQAAFNDAIDPGTLFTLNLDVANEGFAAPINARPIDLDFVCLSGGCTVGSRFKLPTTTDPRLWTLQLAATGKVKDVPTYQTVPLSGTVPADAPAGVYSVNLAMRDPEQELRAGTGGVTQAQEVPFNVELANDLGCSSADAPCDTGDASKWTVWNSTLGINRIGTATVSGVGPPGDCATNNDCKESPTDNTCTTDTCVPGSGASYPMVGRIAISSDGNRHDCDDVGATAVSVALLAKAGLANKLAYYGYADHHWSSESGCSGSTSALREAQMTTSAIGTATAANAVEAVDFTITGGPQSTGVFFNCTKNSGDAPSSCDTSCQQCVDALEAEIRASTTSDHLTILNAGPADIIGRALDEADCDNNTEPSYCQYVRVITHTSFNQNHADQPSAGEPTHSGWKWSEFAPGATLGSDTVTFNVMQNQNGKLDAGASGNGGIATWRDGAAGWDTPTAPVPTYMQGVYNQISNSGTNGDISDAGMTWCAINNNFNAGSSSNPCAPSADQIKAVFTDTSGGGTPHCDRVNNTISCDDGEFCTNTSACAGGKCVGGPISQTTPCNLSTHTCNEGTNACDVIPDPGTGTPGTVCDITPGSTAVIPNVVVDGADPHQILVCSFGCEEDDADCDMGQANVFWGASLMQRAVAKSTVIDAQGWRTSTGIFFLVNPFPDTRDATITVGSVFEGVNVIAGACYTLSGAMTAPPALPTATATAGGSGGVADPRNTSITVPNLVPADSAVVDIHAVGNPGTQTTTQGGQVELFDVNCGAAATPTGIGIAGSIKIVGAAGATSLGWDFSGMAIRDVHALAVFRAFAEPPTTTTTTTSTTVQQATTTSTTLLPPTTTTLPSPDACQDAADPACAGTCPDGQICFDVGPGCACVNPTSPGQIYVCPNCTIPP